ncbi:MAG: TIGR03619 family F420-dependent LLM class oxidoreductase [Myxococcota bacterium]|nr:TIGR03619 family F420-dependent LLM class oxidoreductase [Myxococcota bacterium]
MRYAVQLPTENVHAPAEFGTGEAVAAMARAAEEAGFDACFVTDHPAPGDRWLAGGGHHSLDPFVALAFAAAATRTIRLQTNVLVLPYRNPFLTAKSVATLDALSGGRVILGVATGYLEPEFRALGVDPAERNALTDEALVAMKRVWTEEGVAMQGLHFEAEGNTALPRPAQRPHPPIWVGGNAKRAIRRAVEHGQGWLPFPVPAKMARHIRTAPLATPQDLADRLAYARAHAEAVGRTEPLDVVFVPWSFQLHAGGAEPDWARARDEAAELAALGVTWLVLNVACATRAEYQARLDAIAANLLAR